MKTQTQFKNASLVSVVNGTIVVKSAAGIEHTFINASVVSVNNGTIIIESEWKPKKGELIKAIGGGIDCYVIFDHITSVLHVKASKEISGDYNNLNEKSWLYDPTIVKLSPVTPEEQKEFDDFCKSQGKIWNKKTLQWEKYEWEPERGEKYYYIDTIGDVSCTTYNTFALDSTRIKFGNCFQTKDQAKSAAEKVKELLKSL